MLIICLNGLGKIARSLGLAESNVLTALSRHDTNLVCEDCDQPARNLLEAPSKASRNPLTSLWAFAIPFERQGLDQSNSPFGREAEAISRQ